jgi:CheY-like chemotaxis protein
MDDLGQRAQLLRDSLLDAIEQLRLSARSGQPASAARAHECLTLRYVSGLQIDDVAEELSLSSRQVYRDLHWAEDRLTDLIGLRCQAATGVAAQSTGDAVVREVQALALKPEEVSLVEVARQALGVLAPLAERLRCSLAYQGPEAGVPVSVTPGVLKELIVQLVSAVAQNSPGAEVRLEVSAESETARVRLPLPKAAGLKRRDLLEAALRVAEAHRLRCSLTTGEQGALVCLDLPLVRRRQLLIVEDNPSAIALYERYLDATEWEVVAVTNPHLAAEVAAGKQAEAVVLDIMMPETDGWSVLQALRTNPDTQAVPVVICSVVDDRELGLALGAAACLTKPVTRADLLAALRQAAPRRMLA